MKAIAVAVAVAVTLAACSTPADAPLRTLHASDFVPGGFLLSFVSESRVEHEVRQVRIWFAVGPGRALTAVRAEESGTDGRLVQATQFTAGNPQLVRDYRTCTDDHPPELPTAPLADQLVSDSIGPPMPYDTYGFRRVGDAVEADDGEVRTVLTEIEPGALAGRRLERHHRGNVIEVIRDIEVRRVAETRARAPLRSCG